MAWWNGRGAAPVLAHDGDALLMERAATHLRLPDLARNGQDGEASRIMCAALARLHAHESRPSFDLFTLEQWFEPLFPVAETQGGILRQSAVAAANLLASQREVVVLHGDLHHDNILHFGARDWLAIDPKGLLGERDFDYANMFCNPDSATATAPGRLAQQLEIVTEAAGLERRRLLQWIVAWAGLSTTWLLQDGLSVAGTLEVAELAAAELNR